MIVKELINNMATTYNNCQMGIVDGSGNLSVIYPQTNATLVSCTSAKYGGSSNVTNVQSALNDLSSAVNALDSKIPDLESLYPVGSVYISFNSSMPTILASIGTWTAVSAGYCLRTVTSGTGGTTSNAGNTGSTTLTAAQSGVPAHSHGFTPSGSISGGSHSHDVAISAFVASVTGTVNYYGAVGKSANGNGGMPGSAKTSSSHSHTFTGTAGNTSKNTAANASQGHTHTAGVPANVAVYMWKRTA